MWTTLSVHSIARSVRSVLLITVWLEVRVLPGPPRTLSNLEISRFAPNGPELAGSGVGPLVSAETNTGVEEISAALSLALKSRFPETETVSGGDTVRIGARLSAVQSRSSIELASRPF